MTSQIIKFIFAIKYSHNSRLFGIAGTANIPRIQTVFLKKAVIEHGYPKVARDYISQLPESLEFDAYLHELDVIDRLLRLGD